MGEPPPVANKGLSRRALLAVGAIALAYTVVYAALSLKRHALFNSSTYDLALFDQLIWNMAHGRFFESSIKGFSYLGDHVSPILVLLAPLYWAWDDVRVLLVFQAAAIAVSAFPFAAAAAEMLGDEVGAVLMAAVFLLHPNLGYVNLFDFHPEILLVPLFTTALWAARKGRPWAAAACALAALTVKEDVAITAACFGVYLIFASSRGAGVLVAAVSVAWFAIAMNVVLPANRPPGAAGGYLYMERYAHLGKTLAEVAVNAAFHPGKALIEPYEHWKGVTFLRMFLPAGFLPFVGWPVLLVALPVFGYSYISKYLPQFDIRYQYLTITIPFVMHAALVGVRRLAGLLGRQAAARGAARLGGPFFARAVPLALVLLNGLSIYWIAHSHAQTDSFTRRRNHDEIRAAMSLIPPDASVATLNSLGPHLAHRRTIEFAVPFEPHWYHYERLNLPRYSNADYQLFDTADDRWTMRLMPARIRDLKGRLGYEILYEGNRVVLLKRKEGVPRP